MAQVAVQVNGQEYIVACDDGQEDHLRYLAEFADRHVRDLSESVGKVGEARLLLMALLVVSDELYESYQDLDRAKTVNGAGNVAGDGEKPDSNVAAMMEMVANRIEQVTARLEKA